MTANAVIDGSFAELKFIKSRSVVQMIVELPIERAEEAIQKFGVPLPGQEIPVALARLQMPAASEAPRETRVEQDGASGTNDTKSPSRSEAGKLSYAMKDKMAKAATRAAMLCREPRFRRFLVERYDALDTEASAVEAVREMCGVKSRSEISSNERAYNAFLALELEYQQAVGLAASPR